MHNQTMQRKLKSGDCVDVNTVGTKREDGLFQLREFNREADVDYCDAATERWIWSIGQHRETGEVLASLDARFYPSTPEFECVWLR